MKRLYHPGGSIVTGTALADAVMRYAEALVNRGGTDVVDIPMIAEDGSLGRAQFLIGASSQLVTVTTAEVAAELTESETTQALREKTVSGPCQAAPMDRGGPQLWSPQFDEFDY